MCIILTDFKERTVKMSVSKHAGERLRERCGFNKKTIERMADKAFLKKVYPTAKPKAD